MSKIVHFDVEGANIPSRGVFRAKLTEKVKDLSESSLSKNTREAYNYAYQSFRKFCAHGHLSPDDEPHEVVAMYVAHAAELGMSPNSIASYLAGIKHLLLERDGVEIDLKHKLIHKVMAGYVRESNLERGGPAKKDALSFEELTAIVTMIDDNTLAGERDRCLLLVGFGGGFRRSELAGLEIRDINFVENGVLIRKRDSKGDRKKEGRTVGIERISDVGSRMMCPVSALDEWLEVMKAARSVSSLPDTAPVFPRMFRGGSLGGKPITGESVLLILRKHALASGVITEETADRLGGHSLRSGLITTGYKRGADLRSLARQVDHKRLDTTNGYIRDQDALENNPTGLIFGNR